MSDLIFARKKGDDAWFSPERDILRMTPSCIIRGAAYAVDPNSSIFSWLIQQDGINQGNAVQLVRAGMVELVAILNECHSAPLSDVLTPNRVQWPVLQAIMFGAGITMLGAFNVKFREARMTDIRTHGIIEPTECVDPVAATMLFDSLTAQARS